jgi:transcriptional regulator with XRE-family HTH domain
MSTVSLQYTKLIGETDMNNEATFGQRVQALRVEKRMGIRELGRALDISAMHISNLEKGKSMPSSDLVEKIAAELQGDLDELLHLADQLDPAVVNVIQSNPYTVPSLLRSAKNLTPQQWAKLQKQVEKMAKANATEGED